VSESQIAEGVREAVDEATSGLRIAAGTAARARAKGRRRRAARGLLAVVPAVGLIAGATVALHSGGGSAPSGDAASGSASSPAVQTDAYIVHHVEAALGRAGNYLIATSATSGPGQVTTTYEDPSTGTGRSVVSGSGDKVTYWVQTSVSGGEDHWRTTYVDYTTRTWWTKASHSGALGQDTSGLIVLAADSTPGDLSKALASGEVGVGAKGKVDGHEAIELVYAGSLAKKAAAVRFWVDAKTFQPVEIVSPPFTSASTITESWIPKSAANVAQTDKPQVPAGFRQIPPSPAFN
jgi:hypothetical protein